MDRVGRPLAGALIAVLDGPLAGTTKLTNDAGRFELTGRVAGTMTLRASRDGFRTKTQALSWPNSAYSLWAPFMLDTLEPALPIAPGSYTLTVTSDSSTATGAPYASCTGFPADLLSRTYEASISIRSLPADEHDFLVELASPTLIKRLFQLGITLRVAGQFVGFGIENGWGSDWIEELPGFRYLTLEGSAPTSELATSTETSITIPFSGRFEYCELKSGLGGNSSCYQVPAEQVVEYRSCSSKHDTMVFTKR